MKPVEAGGKVKRNDVRRWPWTEIVVLVLAAGIAGLWYWWLSGGARLAHRQAMAGLVAAPGLAASAPTLEQLGQVGDLFGGLNALFAALAFVGVAWAASLQRRALLDARAAYEVERRAIARQQFEGTFFHLLTLLREIGQESRTLPAVAESMATVDLAAESPTFRHLADVLFASIRTAVPSTPAEQLLRELVTRYESEVHALHSSALGRYFRALHQTLDLIDSQESTCLSPVDKVRYANIVRGQIPESLLFLLAVNGLRAHSTDRGHPFQADRGRCSMGSRTPAVRCLSDVPDGKATVRDQAGTASGLDTGAP